MYINTKIISLYLQYITSGIYTIYIYTLYNRTVVDVVMALVFYATGFCDLDQT